jgi:hypothetical protein
MVIETMGRIHNNAFSSQVADGPNKLECLSLGILAFWTHL